MKKKDVVKDAVKVCQVNIKDYLTLKRSYYRRFLRVKGKDVGLFDSAFTYGLKTGIELVRGYYGK